MYYPEGKGNKYLIKGETYTIRYMEKRNKVSTPWSLNDHMSQSNSGVEFGLSGWWIRKEKEVTFTYCDFCGQEIEAGKNICRVEISYTKTAGGPADRYKDVCPSCVSKIKKLKQITDATAGKRVDYGKVLALHKAGWKGKDIAEEVGVTPAAVCQILRKLKEEGKC